MVAAIPDDGAQKHRAGGLRHRSREYLGVLSAAGARYEGSRRRFHRDSFPRSHWGALTFMQDGRR